MDNKDIISICTLKKCDVFPSIDINVISNDYILEPKELEDGMNRIKEIWNRIYND